MTKITSTSSTHAVPQMRQPQAELDATPPDWELWKYLEEVQLWQAVALSLNLEPDVHSKRAISLDTCETLPPEFHRRFRIASATLKKLVFPMTTVDPRISASLLPVSMALFGEWARSIGWTLPEQFPKEEGHVLQPLAIADVPDPPREKEQRENAPPGTMPNTANGKLAIEAAWELERELNRKADAKEVMGRLMLWARNAVKPDVLKEPGNDGRSVIWITAKGAPKNYDVDALGKTLAAWWKSRI